MRAKDAFLREHGPRCACSTGFPQARVGPAFRGLRMPRSRPAAAVLVGTPVPRDPGQRSRGTMVLFALRGVPCGGEPDELRPRLRRKTEHRAALVLRVAYAHDTAPPGGYLNALSTVPGAVAALEPRQVVEVSPGCFPAHPSPNNFSINESDSAGVSACARRLPYAVSSSRTFPRSVWTWLSPCTSV